MNRGLRVALGVAAVAAALPAAAQVTFYEGEGFHGRSFTTGKQVSNFERAGFNDRASSVEVAHDRWEVCADAGFHGRCVVLRPGRYPSLAAMGLNDRISSVRMINRKQQIDDGRYGPQAAYDARRRGNEKVYEATVTSVRAVVAQSEQHCWTERESIPQDRHEANVPGAIAGAVIGGILGHQVGSGRGNDAATVGGVVAGAAVGSNVGNNHGSSYGRDVQRCTSAPSQARPDYWDVTYAFRGQEHRMQMASPPGQTVMVNSQGEPRA